MKILSLTILGLGAVTVAAAAAGLPAIAAGAGVGTAIAAVMNSRESPLSNQTSPNVGPTECPGDNAALSVSGMFSASSSDSCFRALPEQHYRTPRQQKAYVKITQMRKTALNHAPVNEMTVSQYRDLINNTNQQIAIAKAHGMTGLVKFLETEIQNMITQHNKYESDAHRFVKSGGYKHYFYEKGELYAFTNGKSVHMPKNPPKV